MNSALCCLSPGFSHLFGDLCEFSGLGDQLVDRSVNPLRKGQKTRNGFVVRLREIHFIAVDGLVAGQARGLKDEATRRTDLKRSDSRGKVSLRAMTQERYESLSRGPEHDAGRPWGFCVNRLRLVVDLANWSRHRWMRRNPGLGRPNHAVLDPDG